MPGKFFYYQVSPGEALKDKYFQRFHELMEREFSTEDLIPMEQHKRQFALGERPNAKYKPHILLAVNASGQVLGGVVSYYLNFGRLGYIEYVVTDPQIRSKGVGRKLLQEVEQTMKNKYKAVGTILETSFVKDEGFNADEFLKSMKRDKFYRRAGYQVIDLPARNSVYRTPDFETGLPFSEGSMANDLRIKIFNGESGKILPPGLRAIYTYRALLAIYNFYRVAAPNKLGKISIKVKRQRKLPLEEIGKGAERFKKGSLSLRNWLTRGILKKDLPATSMPIQDIKFRNNGTRISQLKAMQRRIRK